MLGVVIGAVSTGEGFVPRSCIFDAIRGETFDVHVPEVARRFELTGDKDAATGRHKNAACIVGHTRRAVDRFVPIGSILDAICRIFLDPPVAAGDRSAAAHRKQISAGVHSQIVEFVRLASSTIKRLVPVRSIFNAVGAELLDPPVAARAAGVTNAADIDRAAAIDRHRQRAVAPANASVERLVPVERVFHAVRAVLLDPPIGVARCEPPEADDVDKSFAGIEQREGKRIAGDISRATVAGVDAARTGREGKEKLEREAGRFRSRSHPVVFRGPGCSRGRPARPLPA